MKSLAVGNLLISYNKLLRLCRCPISSPRILLSLTTSLTLGATSVSNLVLRYPCMIHLLFASTSLSGLITIPLFLIHCSCPCVASFHPLVHVICIWSLTKCNINFPMPRNVSTMVPNPLEGLDNSMRLGRCRQNASDSLVFFHFMLVRPPTHQEVVSFCQSIHILTWRHVTARNNRSNCGSNHCGGMVSLASTC